LACVTLGLSLSIATADTPCAPFHEPLESAATCIAHGAGILGSVTFPPAINGNGAEFNGAARMFYQQNAWGQAQQGSLSLWFRKNSSDSSGGIAQLGVISAPNSLGLFYDGGPTLIFEVRGGDNTTAAIWAPGSLSTTAFTHIVAAWAPATGGTHLWLYVNGHFVGYEFLPSAFVPSNDRLELGSTGYYGRCEGVIDEVRVFERPLLDGEVYAEYVYSAQRFQLQPSARPASTGPVQIVDGKLFVDGRPFQAKGVGYQPTPIGTWPSPEVRAFIYSDPTILARDMALLRGMNVNTIRLWVEPPNEVLLDTCYNGGVNPIRVIMGFWVPQGSDDDYADPALRASVEAGYRAYVNRYKNHPAVLGWGIGNEVNLVYKGDMRDWFSLVNQLAAAGHEEEGPTYHPAIVINGGLMDLGDIAQGSDDAALPDLDVWGLNLYFGTDAYCHFDYYDLLTTKPMLITEYGIDAWDTQAGTTYEQVHAQVLVSQYRTIRRHALGASLMAYSDEWWKADTPYIHDFGGYGTTAHPDYFSNEEWYGIVSVQDNGSAPDILTPRAAYYALGTEYADHDGDFDGDNDCDLTDFAALQRCLGNTASAPCTAAFDFAVDGVIGASDFAGFAECLAGAHELPSCPP
jgi:hypothetical protein